MKNTIAILGLALLSSIWPTAFAQSLDHCGTMDHLEWKTQENPGLRARMAQTEASAREWLDHNRSAVGGATISIPVVVHVVYKDSTQNISNSQVLSQIDVLNEDFRRLNADTSNTRPEFDSLAADTEIEFCLASVDPQGNPTTGITRTFTQGGQLFGFFGPLDDVKSSTTGGVDPWPTDQYLNVWVCDLVPILAGYAQFPGDDPATDGVVIGYTVYGTEGTAAAPYNFGRTTTHEVGHWLGLRHIWGDGDCTMDDFVSDTPGADANNSGGCFNVKNSCVDAGYDYNDMVENYMDYSNDSCMNMFTEGQKARMWSFLNTDRISLATSQGCNPSVATEQELSRNLFSAYPNPSNGNLFVELQGSPQETGVLRIFNLYGQVLFQDDVDFSEDRVSLDLSGWDRGTYFIQVQGNEESQQQKIILQ